MSCSQIAVLASAEHWHVSAGAQLSLVTSSRGASLGAEAPGQQASTCPGPAPPHSPSLLPEVTHNHLIPLHGWSCASNVNSHSSDFQVYI